MPGRTYHRSVWLITRPEDIQTDNFRVGTEFLYINSGKVLDGYIYRYNFTSADTLRLDYVNGVKTESMGTPTFNIYERLKNNEQ
jgi:hypothetical protein